MRQSVSNRTVRQPKRLDDHRWFRLALNSIAALAALAWNSLFGGGQLWAHPESEHVRIATPVAELAGTLLLVHSDRPVPCCVLVGGTLSQDRQGGFHRPGAPPRDALARWAEAFAAGGYASLRYDPPGRGSRPTAEWTGAYRDEARALTGAVEYLRRDRRIGPVIVVGESAGAYVACLAAHDGLKVDAFIFLGAFCGESRDLYEYNFGRLATYVHDSPDRLAWAERHCRLDLALGRRFPEMLAAAAAGQASFELVDGDFRQTMGGLARRREELKLSPAAAFRAIRAPALALAGEFDLNVPPEHAQQAVKLMREAGNERAESKLIAGVDHSFQRSASDAEVRWRERYELTSFRRPYDSRAYHAALTWLEQRVPTSGETHAEQIEQAASRPTPEPRPSGTALLPMPGLRAQETPELDPVTDVAPERLQLAPGIEIIADVTDRAKTAGVETLEGRIGPLLLGSGSQAHFIEMAGGMYVEEHPHSSESLIYTVRGQWVLCSAGRRQVMKPGSLFRFAPNTPTGYEVPFRDSAFILIFKGDRVTKSEAEFIKYLETMAERLKREQVAGVPYLLRDLKPGHPALKFGAKVNPRFDAEVLSAPVEKR